ncbi:MAG: glycosyltransferase [Candidatus Omnitrophica bacterium]|nr:glycosyltransferase [Candidatus Omnitrophota bacterium]
MNCTPVVSVIIPTYNRAEFLPRAINSVLNQTFKDFELIIVDDGSTEDIKSVVNAFNDNRMRYIRHNIPRGAASARNTGIKYANNDFLAFLDDDDEWNEDKLLLQIQEFERADEKVGLVYSDMIRINDITGQIMNDNVKHYSGDISKEIITNCFIGSPTYMIKKKCFDKIGPFDIELPAHQEWDLFIRLSDYYDVLYLPQKLAIYHMHGDQITTSLVKKIKAWEIILKKHQMKFLKNSKVFSSFLLYLGKLYILNDDYLKGCKLFWNSIKICKLQKKVYFYLILNYLNKNILKRVITNNTMHINKNFSFKKKDN